MNIDYIQETKELISRLRADHADNLATRLQDVLDSASVSTELLMGVRFVLSDVQGVPMSLSTWQAIDRLLESIEVLFKR